MEKTFFLADGGIGSAPVPPEGTQVFASESELERITKSWPLGRLVELWNHLPEVRRVRRFENRAIALRRIWSAIQSRTSKTRQSPECPRTESKTARIVTLLSRPQGATLAELTAATGWQAHSVRGFLSGNLRAKRGLKVHTSKRDGVHIYRLSGRPA